MHTFQAPRNLASRLTHGATKWPNILAGIFHVIFGECAGYQLILGDQIQVQYVHADVSHMIQHEDSWSIVQRIYVSA